jgi:hypothetical protein
MYPIIYAPAQLMRQNQMKWNWKFITKIGEQNKTRKKTDKDKVVKLEHTRSHNAPQFTSLPNEPKK